MKLSTIDKGSGIFDNKEIKLLVLAPPKAAQTNSSKNKNMGRKMVIFFIVFLILLIAVGGFFCWQKSKNESKSPTLFDKDDYKIIEKNGEKFIEVEKVGLIAKVPDQWSIKYEKTPDVKPQYWVDIFSTDAEVFDILTKGCGISINAGKKEEQNQEIRKNIDLIQKTPEKSDEIRQGYNFELIKINNYQGLKWLSPEKLIIGQFSGIDIPIGNEKMISFNTSFPPDYKEKCLSIWEEFIKNISIK